MVVVEILFRDDAAVLLELLCDYSSNIAAIERFDRATLGQLLQEVGELWEKFARKDFRTDPHEFIADGDKVVVLTTIDLEGEAVESADILTYSGAGKLVAFDTRADAEVANRVFAKTFAR